MFKGGCLLGSSAVKVWSSGASSYSGVAPASGTTSMSGSNEREEGEETDKYTANICNTEHSMLGVSLVILGLKWDLLTGVYALFIYQKRAKSYGFSFIQGSDMKIDDTIRFVLSF